MGSFKFQKIVTGDENLDTVQDNIVNSVNSIEGPFLGGVLLKEVSVGTAATSINHRLNRVPQVWVICDQNTNTTIKRTAWNSNSITLQAGSACVINLWVN